MIIKNCPFCGSAKTKIDSKSKSDYKGTYETFSVRCNVCHGRGGTVSGWTYSYNKDPKLIVIASEELENKAIELWNRRS